MGFKLFRKNKFQVNDDKSENIENKNDLSKYLSKYCSVWNLFRTIFTATCIVWFCYNAIKIYDQYTQYNTIVMLQYELPRETDLPAITICGHWITYSEDLKNKYPNYAIEDSKLNQSDPDVVKKMNSLREKYTDMLVKEYSALEIFRNISIKGNLLIKNCKFIPEDIGDVNSSSKIIDCEDVIPIVHSIYDGRKCFTYFSQLNNTGRDIKKVKMVYEMNSVIRIEISSEHHNWPVGRLQNANLIVSVHSPNILPTLLDTVYYRLYPQRYYDFRFNKKIAHLKPPPFKTNCKDYYITDRKGLRSYGDCMNHCIQDEILDDCVNYYGHITEDILSDDDFICEKNRQSYLNYTYARRFCMDKCKSTCTEHTFELTYSAELTMNGDNMNSIIEIRSDSIPYTYIEHKAEIDQEQFIGTVGGHAHIWLGLSAIKIFDIIIHFIAHLNKVIFHN